MGQQFEDAWASRKELGADRHRHAAKKDSRGSQARVAREGKCRRARLGTKAAGQRHAAGKGSRAGIARQGARGCGATRECYCQAASGGDGLLPMTAGRLASYAPDYVADSRRQAYQVQKAENQAAYAAQKLANQAEAKVAKAAAKVAAAEAGAAAEAAALRLTPGANLAAELLCSRKFRPAIEAALNHCVATGACQYGATRSLRSVIRKAAPSGAAELALLRQGKTWSEAPRAFVSLLPANMAEPLAAERISAARVIVATLQRRVVTLDDA